MNTGRVIRDVQADALAVVEAEHRVALKQVSDYVLRSLLRRYRGYCFVAV